MAKTAAQRKQASRARQKDEMGVDAFNEKNNAANRRCYSITKKKEESLERIRNNRTRTTIDDRFFEITTMYN